MNKESEYIVKFAGHGGLQKVWKLFGNDLDKILEEINVELVA